MWRLAQDLSTQLRFALDKGVARGGKVTEGKTHPSADAAPDLLLRRLPGEMERRP
jgi:hypothetical protein